MRLRPWVTLCAVLLPCSGGAWGQESASGRIQGLVLDDERGGPVPFAIVYLDVGPHIRADKTGTFSFEGVPPGQYGIAAVGPGCAVAIGEVAVEAARVVAVDLRVVLGDAEVWQGSDRGGAIPSPETGAWVQVITAKEIEESPAANLLDLIRSKVPGLVGEVSGSSWEVGRLRVRGNNTATQATEPLVVLDGTRIQRRATEVLSQLSPNQVSRIEVSRGSAGAWIHGTGSANGVIRIFTRSLAPASGTAMDPEECGNPFGVGGEI